MRTLLSCKKRVCRVSRVNFKGFVLAHQQIVIWLENGLICFFPLETLEIVFQGEKRTSRGPRVCTLEPLEVLDFP